MYQPPPTANRHQPPTPKCRQPPTATNRHPPTTANRHQPPIPNHQLPPTTINRHQPLIANSQPPTANRQQGESTVLSCVHACVSVCVPLCVCEHEGEHPIRRGHRPIWVLDADAKVKGEGLLALWREPCPMFGWVWAGEHGVD